MPAVATKSATWTDLDNNGYLDFLLSDSFTGGLIILNNIGGSFHAATLDVIQEISPREISCFDYDNDGDEDCIMVIDSDLRADVFLKNILKNNGDLQMTKTAHSPEDGDVDYAAWIGLDDMGATRSLAVGDYDEDGYLDIFLANRDPHRSNLDLPKLFHNIGGPPEPGFPNGLGHAYHWMKFDLEGLGAGMIRPDGTYPSNRSGIGARVFIRSLPSGKIQNRFVRPASEHALPVHFGLKEDTMVDRVYIKWPGGIRQTLSSLSVDRAHHIREGDNPFVNDAPRFKPISPIRVGYGENIQFTVEVSDLEMGAIALTHGALPRGAIFDDATRTFSWTPARDQAGRYSVTFTARDPEGVSRTMTVSIEVRSGPTLQPLVPDQPEYHVTVGTELSIQVSARDPDGDRITYSYSSLPMVPMGMGIGINPDTGLFSWVPLPAHIGRYMVTFRARTPDGQSDYITRPIVVDPRP